MNEEIHSFVKMREGDVCRDAKRVANEVIEKPFTVFISLCRTTRNVQSKRQKSLVLRETKNSQQNTAELSPFSLDDHHEERRTRQ